MLLVKHTYIAGWYLPGGAVEVGESSLQAAIRELQEEVGAVPEATPIVFGVYHSTKEKRDDYIILYSCKNFSLTPVLSNEIAEIGWFAWNALPEGTSPATKRRIEEYQGVIPASDKW